MEEQADRLFGKKLYGIDKVAEQFASHANKIFTNFSTGVPPNKTTYPLASLLSDKGTGKSSFLDRHAELIRKHCENQQLKELLDPKSHPLVLNITLSSGTDYSAEEGSSVSGEDSIARRLVCAYAQAPWEDVRALSVGSYDLLKVLELIVQHHKQVNKMEAAQKVVVVLNVDDLNQVHRSALDQKKADFRVMEIASAQLSQHEWRAGMCSHLSHGRNESSAGFCSAGMLEHRAVFCQFTSSECCKSTGSHEGLSG